MAPVPRNIDDQKAFSLSSNNILYGVFLLFVLVCSTTLVMLYFRRRKAIRQTLPPIVYQSRQSTPGQAGLQHEQVYVYDDKMNLVSRSDNAQAGPVPEIRITFPDEDGQCGRNASDRIVVVKISDSGNIGLEPLHSEQLPPYQRQDAGRFQSLDLNRMGGLREGQPQRSTQRWA